MYLSKITPNLPLIIGKQGRKSPVYLFHQLIWECFAQDAHAKRDFLFRLDTVESGISILVLSEREAAAPSWALDFQTKKFAPNLTAGMQVGFKVRVNPVVRGKEDRKRHDIIMHSKKRGLGEGKSSQEIVHSACFNWLVQKGERSGFLIIPDSFRADSYRQEKITDGHRHLSLAIADLSGLIKITQPDLFMKCLKEGVGSSRGLGCGMLLLRKSS